MAVATAYQGTPSRGAVSRPSMVAVGTIVWLSSELMFFAALFAMYFTKRAVATGPWPPPDVDLNIPLSLTFTLILVASSFTCQWGVFAAERGDVHAMRRWYSLTLAMGTVFVAGQLYEYSHHDFTLSTHDYGSVYYLTTGFHMLHVIGGLIAFVVVLTRSGFGRYTHEQATSAIVTSYYWHFVDVVWIALYATIYFLK